MTQPAPSDVCFFFSDADRLIYPYHDGDKQVFGDPLAIHRRLQVAARGDLDGLIRAASDPPPEEQGSSGDAEYNLMRLHSLHTARERLALVLCEGFGLLPFDPSTGKGTTEAMALRVWADYANWLEKNEKRAG